MDRFFGRDEWQIKELEVVVTPSGGDDIRFQRCACVRGTSMSFISPGMLPLLVIGLLDCVCSPLGCSDWLSRLSWWAWLAGRRMSVPSMVVVCPGGVRIVYIKCALTESSSLDTAPVTGSLLFYAPVCCLAVCCAAEVSSWVLFGGTDCIWLAGRGLFFRQVGVTLVMATDSAAATGGRADITFGVELVVPWDAPEAVIDLHSDGVMDLNVFGLTGRRPGAAVYRILQGRDVRSVRVLVPDSRGLEQDFHDVTIVDMGDLPESPVSMDELSLLRRQWPPTVLCHMVWLQQDLDTMRAEAKKRFRNARPAQWSYCNKWIKCDMYRHVAMYHLDLSQLWHCPVSWCTVWKGTPQDCMDHVRVAHDVQWGVKSASPHVDSSAPGLVGFAHGQSFRDIN